MGQVLDLPLIRSIRLVIHCVPKTFPLCGSECPGSRESEYHKHHCRPSQSENQYRAFRPQMHRQTHAIIEVWKLLMLSLIKIAGGKLSELSG